MKSSREIPILLLVAMGLTLLPAPIEAACDMFPHPDFDPCDTMPAVSHDGLTGEGHSDHGDDDCCETGCQHCSLPCCSGTSMLSPAAQVLETAPAVDGRQVAPAISVTRVDADPLYHPPRG